ncbi:GTP 3',8-cyclase MoaA [Blastopirellula retiformator]|uniref:GTP 3',8-cyclase n=1 Tax=Blastopirellula retiformator TaxID=2527970 RepID=A0A5C5UTY2_9BACT|nr:GTP 3',8-cyclase MoaA [Blastopirellula retiformator]TWT29706.1 Cyclic pyranopterin monophosphate synthase [Blastopirellula retiformator]
MSSPPLVDGFGRVHASLRISVTDRCNIRCFYCMPLENVQFKPRNELLTFEEIERVARVAVSLGIRKFRITGGEPLVRAELPKLIERLAAIPGVDDLALTTNGLLLTDQAADLHSAGLTRLNVSLDSLSEEVFQRITRRQGVQRVLDGIAAAHDAGFRGIRLNAVSIRGLTEGEIVPLARFSRDHDLELRFIEFMPLDADRNWRETQVLSGGEVREVISRDVAPLTPATRGDLSQPAVDYVYADSPARVGFINSVTAPFCGDCNRLRITAEGQLRNCLFSTEEWDVRGPLRGGADDMAIKQVFRDCTSAKKRGHGGDDQQFASTERAMYQIGG